jgi:putative sigma-54 modulation protein
VHPDKEYAMTLDISTRHVPLDAPTRELIERRLAYALGRFAARVRSVTARFEDLNGPRGGVDIQCRMEAVLVPRGQVLVEVTDVTAEAAASRASQRLARRIRTVLEARRGRRRRSPLGRLDTAEAGLGVG